MTFQFKIQLKDVTKPPVWRKIKVPAQFDFLKFHEVIQAAFGWENYHLFEFSPAGYGSGPGIGMPDPTGWDEGRTIDARKMKLSETFKEEGQKFTYIYDLGDNWQHQIILEEMMSDKTIKADVLGGKGACPPEDCGGPWGYEALKKALENPAHPEHEDMREWLEMEEDEYFDPKYFELEEVRQVVRII